MRARAQASTRPSGTQRASIGTCPRPGASASTPAGSQRGASHPNAGRAAPRRAVGSRGLLDFGQAQDAAQVEVHAETRFLRQSTDERLEQLP